VRATRDIVFIDQRGTGRSGKLDCKSKPEHERMSEAQMEAELRACIHATKAPFSAYTTDAAARDIELVRRALGYGAVNVWGGSYGTRLGQAYARLYPASVRSLVLDGVAAPDQVIPAGARDGQAALDKMFALCAKDAGCKARPSRTCAPNSTRWSPKLEGGPIKLSMPDPRTAQPVEVNMTRSALPGHRAQHPVLAGRRAPPALPDP
jgi:pimeloyl-ACP methyl ester carboxylesterase